MRATNQANDILSGTIATLMTPVFVLSLRFLKVEKRHLMCPSTSGVDGHIKCREWAGYCRSLMKTPRPRAGVFLCIDL